MSSALAFSLILAAAGAAAPPVAPPALSLAQAAELALAHSALAGEAAASRDAAAAAQDLAHDAFMPQMAVKATPGYASGLPVAVADEVPAAAGVELRQTIYDPTLHADELEARARRAEAGASWAETNQNVVSRAADLYAAVRTGESRLAARKEILEARTAAASRAAALASEGRLAPIESDRRKLEADLAQASEVEAESSLNADRRALGDLVGLRELPPLTDDPLTAVAEPQDSVPDPDANPAILALGEAIDLFDRSEHARTRLFTPTITGEAQYLRLSDSYGYDKYYNNFKADDFTIGIAIVLPLWTGGAARDAARRSRAEREILENRRRQRREDLDLARMKAGAGLASTRTRLELSRRARELAERDLAHLRVLESDGRADPDAVVNAKVALGSAREAEADAELSAFRARLVALEVDGRLSPARLGPDGGSRDGE